MDLIEPLAEVYAERYSSATAPLLEEIAAYTAANHPEAHMLSGPLQGKFLEIVSRLMRPRRILEIGTFMGYSALCLAAGLAEEGRLHTIELRAADADLAEGNFRRANWQDRIILHRGNALAIIPTLDEIWDLVFIDADKTGYIDYYNLVMPKLRQGGLILADNVLFHGQVLQPEIEGKSAKAIQAFNEMVAADRSVEKVMLTMRDGLFVIQKK
ncbi:MAG TPA: O-methyltransferase [Puia sp.]|jgi:predicted O-methyltransferase YrrM|nr:O-methyltransferase [Puia sp.]